ncbi:Peptidyl-tRNA hydrolase [Fundidesulfovibrio magnetotacticus]|uniref:Peptidyl-tRNA hydrolase n=1 Tax=Fundidesulfovibrio magnetotacticus TaxID=2730080 RepID=A0A6V8M4T0_9BACT|nr:aminoacyl-tRNA hydrolase [Fundidesulfovibrio magnetotacticus]GFK95475.1 Peptidyl-tRNA hydrolase [Fundidesulfovibrio magnetotacticus]
MPPRALIAGLGNPGPKYQGNRHNFGFHVADALLAAGSARGLSMGKEGDLSALRLPGVEGEVLVLKPMTFMNLSGRAVAHALRYYRLAPADLLVLHDELDLPLGRLRMKFGGGLAGHNGLKSIAQETGTQDFARLRLGIGRPPGRMDVAAFVLQDFRGEERPAEEKVVAAAVAAVRLYLAQGLETAQREAGAFNAELPKAE